MTETDPKPCAASDSSADIAMYRLILENAVDLIVRLDARRQRMFVSPSSREVLGFEPAELLGASGYDLVHPDDHRVVFETIGQISESLPCLQLVFRMRRKDGRYIWVEGRYRHLPADNGLIAMLRDITPQKHAEEALAKANVQLEAANQALHRQVNQDGLTGLANRRCFDQTLDMEFRRARRQDLPLGLVLVDVDYFKAYNDRYGHIAGDECLRRISRAIESSVRRPGDLVARYGGEEIVALLPAIDLEGAAAVANVMRESVSSLAIEHPGSSYGVTTVSAGASVLWPVNGARDPLDLVRAADRALYQAKANGRNRVNAGQVEADDRLERTMLVP